MFRRTRPYFRREPARREGACRNTTKNTYTQMNVEIIIKNNYIFSCTYEKKVVTLHSQLRKVKGMSNLASQFEEDRKGLRKWYFNSGPISLFTLGLVACVCASYWLSRYMPEDVFAHIISPILHICILAAAVIGAIVTQFHIDGIYARRMWQLALIAWAAIEGLMLLVENFFNVSTLVGGVETITRGDFIARDILAIILLAYPMEVLCPKWLNWWRGALLVLPSILIALLDKALHEDMRALMIIYPLLIAWWLYGKIREYRANVENNFSSLENSAMPWVKIYLIILTVIGLSYFYLSFTYHPTRLFTQQWLVLALLIYNSAQIALRRKPWKEEILENAEEEEEEDAVRKSYREKLESWMRNAKPYVNPEFRLVDLMQILPMNRTYLSKFINVEYGCSFYQFVTKYRIEEAQRLMQEHPEWKLQDVAEQSGFSSPTIFSRVFARETGYTPSEWMEQIDNS